MVEVLLFVTSQRADFNFGGKKEQTKDAMDEIFFCLCRVC